MGGGCRRSIPRGADELYWDEDYGHPLYVPGRLLMMHEPWSSEKANDDDSSSSLHSSSSDDDKEKLLGMWTDGTNAVWRGFEIGAGSGLVTDHLTSSYCRALASLDLNRNSGG